MLFQLLALGTGDGRGTTDSRTCSTLRVTLVLAVFPALAVAFPLNDWFAPGVVTWIADGQRATPERTSEQVKLMVAGTVSSPCALAAGMTAAVMIGRVLSMFKVTLVLAVCIAASGTLALITWFAPSALTVCAAGHCNGGTPPLHV